MQQTEELDMSNGMVKFCVSYVTCRVAAEGVKLLVASCNNHYILGRL